MDLVEVAPMSKPPVCRIMDYGKFMYSQRKKERKSHASHHETQLKELRIRTPKIGDHDLMIKVNRAKEFLQRGDRVQFSLRFRGRELAHIDEGQKVFTKIKEALGDISKIERDFRREGRRITMMLAPSKSVKPPDPKPKAKPKPKPEAQDKPAPAPETTPTPEATPAPAPETTPTPEATPAPAPETTPTPDVTPPPTPEPKDTE